jgi:hypothetical protein
MPHVTFIHGIGLMNGHPGTYDANEGIQMQRIIEAVRAAGIPPPRPSPPVQVEP